MQMPPSCPISEITQDVGKYDLHFQVCTVMALQEAAEYYMTGLLEYASLSAPCEMHHHYAQRHSIIPSYPWRASLLLNASSSLKSV